MRMTRFVSLLVALTLPACGGGPVPVAGALNNTAPVARAPDGVQVPVGVEVVLDGSASYDPDLDEISFHWTLEESPPESTLGPRPFSVDGDRNADVTSFVPDVPGLFVVALQVVDSRGLRSDTDRVVVEAREGGDPPIADGGADRVGLEGSLICLDGSGSSDAGGAQLTFTWTIVSRPAQSELASSDLEGADSAEACLVPDAAGSYLLSLVVNNGSINSEPDFVAVTAASTNQPPVADVEVISAASCSFVQLDGSGSVDPDGDPVTYSWHLMLSPVGASTPQGAEAFDDPHSPTPRFYADLEGAWYVQLVVDDGKELSEPVMIGLDLQPKLENAPPVVAHTPDAYLQDQPSNCAWSCPAWQLTLDAVGSIDPDGDTVKITWEVLTGDVELSAQEGWEVSAVLDGPPGSCFGHNDNEVEIAVTATDCLGDSDTSVWTALYVCGVP